MPQQRQYQTAAQRQSAYRARKPKPISQARLATLATSIYYAVCQGFQAGDTPLPAQVLGENIEHTLRNLICYLDPVRDTIRHPDWDRFHPAKPQTAHEPTGAAAAG